MRGSLHFALARFGRDDGILCGIRQTRVLVAGCWFGKVEQGAEAGAGGGEGVVEAEQGRGDFDGARAGEADDADAAAAGGGGDGNDGVGGGGHVELRIAGWGGRG